MLPGTCCSATYANLAVAHKQVTEHVIMLKEIFDKHHDLPVHVNTFKMYIEFTSIGLFAKAS